MEHLQGRRRKKFNTKKRNFEADMADEAGFLELLVANERIGRTLDVLCDPYQRSKYEMLFETMRPIMSRPLWHNNAAAVSSSLCALWPG